MHHLSEKQKNKYQVSFKKIKIFILLQILGLFCPKLLSTIKCLVVKSGVKLRVKESVGWQFRVRMEVLLAHKVMAMI